MKALILTGGFGTRLKEVIHDRPKVLAPINGRPFLEYLIGILRKNGIDNIIISTGYLGDYIRQHFQDGQAFGIKIDYSEEARPLGTGGAAKIADKFFTEPYFVINGDTYLETDYGKIFNSHIRNKARVTIAVVRRRVITQSGFVSINAVGKVTAFIEKSKNKKEGFVNSGVYVFSPKTTNIIKNKKRYSLEKDLFPKLAKRGELYAFKVKDDFIDIGTKENYALARKVLSQKRYRVIEVSVPSRISFAGGGTDLPAYFSKNGGMVVGAVIKKYVHLHLKTWDHPKIHIQLPDFNKEEFYTIGKFLPYDNSTFDLFKAAINKFKLTIPCQIIVWSDFPAGSGLGSSSATAIVLIYAILTLQNIKTTTKQLAELSIELERSELNIPGGWQDQYLCSQKGFNFLEFSKKGNVKVHHLNLNKKTVEILSKNLSLFYIGGKRAEKIQQSALIESDLNVLNELAQITKKIVNSLKAGNLQNFGKLLNLAWEIKKKSSDKISNSYIDKIYNEAIVAGALGGKLLGSGGGGYLLIYCPEKFSNKVINALSKYSLQPEKVNFDLIGPKITSYES